MGEAKRKAARANDEKTIEASEQERFVVCMFFNRFVSAENRIDQRRYARLFEDFDLDTIADTFDALPQEAKEGGANLIAGYSAEMLEYTTTLDVIEYFTKTTDAKVPGPWVRLILKLAERMLACKEGTYKPSSEALPASPNGEHPQLGSASADS